jgi:cytidylate kinase
VVEGRDIGSVVLPEADLKVWLVADPAVRAVRRAAEDAAAGRTPLAASVVPARIEAVVEDLARRDSADSTRAASPTTQAPDAVVVDATDLGLDEVIETVVALVRERASS